VKKPGRKHGEEPKKAEGDQPAQEPDAPRLAPEPDAAAEPSPEELEQLRQKASERDEFLERMQRMKADTQNYKNRLAKESETQRQYATQGLVTDLLPLLDNLDRAIDSAEGDADGSGLLGGVQLARQQALKVLGGHGVEPIPAVGEPFDPSEHEAVLQMPSDEHGPGTVIEEVQKGYRLRDRVVRPSKVIVAAPPAEPEIDPAAEPADPPAHDTNQE